MIDKLASFGIHQLNAGESISDALDYVDGKMVSRKGHRIYSDSGRKLSRNEIIAAANKEAFSKTVREPEWVGCDIETVDINTLEDYRENLNENGEVQECQYCGTGLRVDKGAQFDILNCASCHNYAVLKNCM